MKFMLVSRLPLISLLAITALLGGCGGGGDDDLLYISGPNEVRPLKDELADRTPANNGGGEVIDDTETLDDLEVTEGNVHILVPGRSMLEVISVDINTATQPGPLPQGLTQIGQAIDVVVSDTDQALLNGPLTITLTYDQAAVTNEGRLLVLHHDGGSYQPVTVLNQDEQANTVTFESRRFSTFVLAESDGNIATTFDTGFSPQLNGWDIANFGAYFAPGGNSFGMAGYAAWYFSTNPGQLNGAYLTDVARIAAARVQISQGETWGIQDWRQAQNFKDEDLAQLIKTYLSTFNTPLVLTMGQDIITQAALVYAYDASGFYIYDPNFPGESQLVSFNGASFGNYGNLNNFGYAALASFGLDSDFQALSQEADAGFPGSENLSIDTPVEGEQIAAREAELSGSFLNDLSEETSLYVEIKGVGRQLSIANGAFSNVIEISHGPNTIVALAGVDASTENNWFKNAPTAIREVAGTLPPARLLVTLTWEQNETDVDLYITEPEGETMWFGGRDTPDGLELDFDDTTGFGPEHGTLEVGILGDSTTDQTQEGEYIVRVHYFSDDGLGVDATGRVTIVINEGEPEQKIRSVRFRIADDNSSTSGPGGTGSAWVDIAKVNVVEGTISTDFTEPAADSQ